MDEEHLQEGAMSQATDYRQLDRWVESQQHGPLQTHRVRLLVEPHITGHWVHY